MQPSPESCERTRPKSASIVDNYPPRTEGFGRVLSKITHCHDKAIYLKINRTKAHKVYLDPETYFLVTNQIEREMETLTRMERGMEVDVVKPSARRDE